MEVQVINSAQVTVVVTDNLQKWLLRLELTICLQPRDVMWKLQSLSLHLLCNYGARVCVYLVVLQIPALDLFVLSTGEQIQVVGAHSHSSYCTEVTC